MHRLYMALLMQHFGALLQIPETPRRIVAASAQEAAGWVEAEAGDTMRHMALDVCYRLLAFQVPQFYGTVRSARGDITDGLLLADCCFRVEDDGAHIARVPFERLLQFAVGDGPDFAQSAPEKEKPVRNRRIFELRFTKRRWLEISNSD